MKILAFDSTAKAASVSILSDGKILADYTVDNGLTQSELLLPMAEAMLGALKLDFSDIDIFATSVGPGSFTGVRIGTALVKGLAFGREAATVAVSTIEALAENLAGIRGIIVPCMDARRGQVYTALFRSDEGGIRRLTEDMAIPLTTLRDMLKEYGGEPIYLTGDGYTGAHKALTELGLELMRTPERCILESAASVARVAERIYLAGGAVSDKELAPTYLRVPQAERERLERLDAEKSAKS
ncbi:MAG: tRNA (adenosine(37)-N6)-threonylcarbamoyltransferase complex dimerization subunit type 1 TsaB [Clostridia bacterium]|nr:tRNA (adenosine(37)-N6)-threonylcarbamoyltransferase complex dimerization subunit type 1 TsaB [Clostridia bacterium]